MRTVILQDIKKQYDVVCTYGDILPYIDRYCLHMFVSFQILVCVINLIDRLLLCYVVISNFNDITIF